MKVGSLIRLKIARAWHMAIVTVIKDNSAQLWWLDGAPKQPKPYDWFKLESLKNYQKDKTLEVIYV